MLAALAITPASAASLQLGDALGNNYTAINDFEQAPAGLVGPNWLQDGIDVRQINGDAIDNWTTSGFGNGARSWYPNGGDDGWTRIRRADASDFDAVSLFGDSGWITQPQSIYWELADDGAVVASGFTDASFLGQWRSFVGGGFDEVRLRAHQAPLSLDACVALGNFRCNYFWLDDVKIGASPPRSVPEPHSGALAAGALALLALRGRAMRRLSASLAESTSVRWRLG